MASDCPNCKTIRQETAQDIAKLAWQLSPKIEDRIPVGPGARIFHRIKYEYELA